MCHCVGEVKGEGKCATVLEVVEGEDKCHCHW